MYPLCLIKGPLRKNKTSWGLWVSILFFIKLHLAGQRGRWVSLEQKEVILSEDAFSSSCDWIQLILKLFPFLKGISVNPNKILANAPILAAKYYKILEVFSQLKGLIPCMLTLYTNYYKVLKCRKNYSIGM